MHSAPGKRVYREAELLRTALEVFHNTTGLQMGVDTKEITENAGRQAHALGAWQK